MSSSSRILEIVKTAIQMEKEGYKFYMDNADKISDPNGRAMFKQLAKDELDHQKLFEMEHDSLEKTGTWTRPEKHPETVFPKSQIFPSRQQVEKIQEKPNEFKVLEIGIELERKSHEFYSSEAKRTDEPNERATLNHLAEIERGHLAILEAERDSLRNTGYWFDFKEISLE